MNEICKAHQTAFFSVCGFFVTALLVMISYMVINNNRAIAAEQQLAEALSISALAEKDNNSRIIEQFSRNYNEIIQRLTRIETKIEKI